MEEAQKKVNKMWDDISNGHNKMNGLYEKQSVAETEEERDKIQE
jgi:hypothetical protein